ncbi:MAG: hypothetical protein HRK26_04330 [Rickettsiaceae bacterium H1]|nr:hypothetical protein [Rickettsiaceae bacterium H1]
MLILLGNLLCQLNTCLLTVFEDLLNKSTSGIIFFFNSGSKVLNTQLLVRFKHRFISLDENLPKDETSLAKVNKIIRSIEQITPIHMNFRIPITYLFDHQFVYSVTEHNVTAIS